MIVKRTGRQAHNQVKLITMGYKTNSVYIDFLFEISFTQEPNFQWIICENEVDIYYLVYFDSIAIFFVYKIILFKVVLYVR